MFLSTLRGFILLILSSTVLLPAVAQPAKLASDNRTLEFVENKGQWDARARYVAELPAGRLFLGEAGFTYALVDAQALHDHNNTQAQSKQSTGMLRAHAYSVTFEGASPNTSLRGNEATTERRNYFLDADPSKWASEVRGFRTVSYADVYAGIGVHLYENEQQHLEYDFTVAPGARPSDIRLRYQGADRLKLQNGNLLIQTSVGKVQEQAPQAWQRIGEKRVPVSCAFVLKENVLSFKLGRYNAKYPLVIDPTVVFSTSTGSRADNWGYTATYDAQGNLYSGGIVFSMGFPTTNGAYDTSFSGNEDISIIKYNTTVSGTAARLYATYLGGNQADAPHSLVVNKQGELVIFGSTGSDNFPTTRNAYDRSFNGGPAVRPFPAPIREPDATPNYPKGADMFVAKLSANGSNLTGATLLGGNGTDGLHISSPLAAYNYGDEFRGDVITDDEGNIYLASTTTSSNFPTSNGFRTSYQGGGSDAVVCKLSPDLQQLIWGTYLGGSGYDGAYSIQLDASRNVYVCGGTNSSNFPTTSGSLHPTAQGGIDGFVACLSSAGNVLQRGTYIGTSAYDQAYFLQLDGSYDVYLLGQSKGAFPVTTGLYSVAGGRQFVQKLDNTLSKSLYSTTFGSGSTTLDLALTAFLVDDCERVYISGWGGGINYDRGSTTRLPITPDAIQRTTDGSDFYLAEFTPGMRDLEYGTFYGQAGVQEHVDGGTSRFDKRGVVYQAVCGGCGGISGFPVPPGANTYTRDNNSLNCNNASFKVDFGALTADPGPSRFVCTDAGPIRLGGSPAGGVWSGPGVSAIPGGGYQFTPSSSLLGRNTLTYVVATAGICFSTRTLRMTVVPVVAPTVPSVPPICRDAKPITLTASPAGGTYSGPGMSGNTFNPAQAGVGTHLIRYTLPDSVACGSITQTITVSAPPTVQVGRDTTLCADQTRAFRMLRASPAGGTWSGTGITADGMFTPPNTNNRGGIFTLSYTITQNGCAVAATRKIVIAPTSSSNVPLDIPVCEAAPQYTGLAPFNCQFAPVLTGGTYEWDFGDQTTSTEEAPLHRYEKPGTYQVKLTARYANCQVETRFAPVEVGDVFVPNIITPNNDGKNELFIPRFSCQPATLRIFTRWGSKVYETDNYRNDWHGGDLADGVYYYHLRDTEGRAVKGWLEVKRN
ncbi:gliding motility-associated C-terminal domain-containing protein [Hymenobacter sp. GOD-10R]|uniref:DUF7948 domain-containing protein n=1 Tax=Hymenobacter sp. GOD-10R TaxID=3093922 RepID=UPI002D771157|nr:gliding motility-associated C-terminal domain-containing protein [Hymenobacter sp. GOD-10R]WRQ29242.1 gliding motility-associated C-terminal domain-containing protein [Hymenobacter sp. GOD-10R]